MELSLECLEEVHIRMLSIYNYIKNNEILKEYAEMVQRNGMNNDKIAGISKSIINEMDKEFKNLFSNISSDNTIQATKIESPVKIYMDGVFDIIHSGHFNAIRQSKKLGDYLIVGVNSDADCEKAKGPLLMNVHERAALASACKWIDEVVINTPYTPTIQFLDEIGTDFCAHGDDMPVNENGVGCYDEIKNSGRLKVFKRTEGISTTEIVGRLLMYTKERNLSDELIQQPITSSDLVKSIQNLNVDTSSNQSTDANKKNTSDFERGPILSNFLATGWRLVEFCSNKTPTDKDVIVYIDGSFDILHIGHVEALKKAREFGTYLYVGVHDDSTVRKFRGQNYPILNLQERVFNLLALKYVDDVVIGAPWTITEDLVKSLRISVVVQGTVLKYDEEFYNTTYSNEDPYLIPKKLGIYHTIISEYDLTNEILVKRLLEKRDSYIKKYTNRSKKETDYYKNAKKYLQEI